MAEARGRPWTRREEARLLAMWAAGRTSREIAADLDRSHGAVKNRLHQTGAPKRCRRPGWVGAAVKRLWRPGRSDPDLADAIGCGVHSVQEARRRLGIPAGISRSEAARIAAAHREAYRHPDGRD